MSSGRAPSAVGPFADAAALARPTRPNARSLAHCAVAKFGDSRARDAADDPVADLATVLQRVRDLLQERIAALGGERTTCGRHGVEFAVGETQRLAWKLPELAVMLSRAALI